MANLAVETVRSSIAGRTVDSEEMRKMGQLANFFGQRRYEVGILTDVLTRAPGPIRRRELSEEVRRKVDGDQQDGLVPPYRVTTTLIRVTLGIMTDLGAVQSKRAGVSLTPRVLDVIEKLKHTIPMGRDYREPTSRV